VRYILSPRRISSATRSSWKIGTSIVLRWTAWGLTRYVSEPNARHTWDVVQELVSEMLDRLEIRLSPSEMTESGSEIAVFESNPVASSLPPRVPVPKLLGQQRSRDSQEVKA
jgi:hypothetical protein